MRTSSLSGDNSLRARRIRVNAAFPEETRKQCLTPKCSFSSDSKRSNSRWPRKIPQTPEIISLMPIGVAAGGRALPICISGRMRSEEHTSELQSLRHLVCRLLLEKKKHRPFQGFWV